MNTLSLPRLALLAFTVGLIIGSVVGWAVFGI